MVFTFELFFVIVGETDMAITSFSQCPDVSERINHLRQTANAQRQTLLDMETQMTALFSTLTHELEQRLMGEKSVHLSS
jgi:hypothetical protein